MFPSVTPAPVKSGCWELGVVVMATVDTAEYLKAEGAGAQGWTTSGEGLGVSGCETTNISIGGFLDGLSGGPSLGAAAHEAI